MLKPSETLMAIDIPFELSDSDRTILCAYVKQQGFDIVQKLLEDIVKTFSLRLMNTDSSKPESVIANHYLAKAASAIYAGLILRIKNELNVETYNNTESNIDNPDNDMVIEELR